jgi:hypothetical protein
LKESISDYREAQSAIEKLTTGTDEWREAIKEANEQVMNLITQYPELVKYMSSIGGQLTISDEGLDALDQKE